MEDFLKKINIKMKQRRMVFGTIIKKMFINIKIIIKEEKYHNQAMIKKNQYTMIQLMTSKIIRKIPMKKQVILRMITKINKYQIQMNRTKERC